MASQRSGRRARRRGGVRSINSRAPPQPPPPPARPPDFRPRLRRLGPAVCFEVKPKAGFLPASRHIAPAHGVKRRSPRFALHQLLKHLKVGGAGSVQGSRGLGSARATSRAALPCQRRPGPPPLRAAPTDRGGNLQGKAPAISRYCPLDFFGGAPALQEAALGALMEAPHNNLKARPQGGRDPGGRGSTPARALLPERGEAPPAAGAPARGGAAFAPCNTPGAS
jgi:hypothetical protein